MCSFTPPYVVSVVIVGWLVGWLVGGLVGSTSINHEFSFDRNLHKRTESTGKTLDHCVFWVFESIIVKREEEEENYTANIEQSAQNEYREQLHQGQKCEKRK